MEIAVVTDESTDRTGGEKRSTVGPTAQDIDACSRSLALYPNQHHSTELLQFRLDQTKN